MERKSAGIRDRQAARMAGAYARPQTSVRTLWYRERLTGHSKESGFYLNATEAKKLLQIGELHDPFFFFKISF